MKHEDSRRIIYDFGVPKEMYASLKVVYIGEEISVGDHYHNKKDEIFFLASGQFKELELGDTLVFNIEAPYVVNVPKGLYHRFICSKGSILFGAATKEFDPEDEIKR